MRTTPCALAALRSRSLAAPAAPAPRPKLGYVDLQRALNEVDEGKAAKAAPQARLRREAEAARREEDRVRQAAGGLREAGGGHERGQRASSDKARARAQGAWSCSRLLRAAPEGPLRARARGDARHLRQDGGDRARDRRGGGLRDGARAARRGLVYARARARPHERARPQVQRALQARRGAAAKPRPPRRPRQEGGRREEGGAP